MDCGGCSAVRRFACRRAGDAQPGHRNCPGFPISNLLRLINDAGTAWLAGTPGERHVTEQPMHVDLRTATIAPSGNNIALSVPLTLTAAFAGAKQVWMYATGTTNNSGWQSKGAWTVP